MKVPKQGGDSGKAVCRNIILVALCRLLKCGKEEIDEEISRVEMMGLRNQISMLLCDMKLWQSFLSCLIPREVL